MTLRVTPQQLVDDAERSGTLGLLARAPGWGRVRLDRVARVINGAPFSSRLFNKDGRGFPLIRIRDVATSEVSTWYDGPFDDLHVVEAGALLVGMDGDFRVARWRGPTGLLNQRVCRLEVNTALYDERLLALVLQGYLDAIWKATSSVTVKHLSSRSVAEIPLPLPPRDEQRRIVDILEDHLSRLDAGDAGLSTVRRRIAALRGAVADAAASGRLVTPPRPGSPTPDSLGRSPLPEGWRWLTLNDLQAPQPGAITDGPFGSHLASRHYTESGPRVIRLQNIGDGAFLDHEAHISQAHFETLEKHAVQPGDLLVASLGTDLPKACVAPADLGPAIVKADCIRVRLAEDVEPEFVSLVLNAPSSRRRTARLVHGVGRPRLGLGGIRKLDVPIPEWPTQQAVLTIARQWLDASSRLRHEAEMTSQRLGALRRAVLQSAFSGRLTGASSDVDLVEELAGV